MAPIFQWLASLFRRKPVVRRNDVVSRDPVIPKPATPRPVPVPDFDPVVVTPAKKSPLGIANNNPGNLRRTDIDWLGEVVGWNGEFERFTKPEYGIRALAKNLLAYQERHGLRTIAAIISRWAPDSENDTDSYIAAVAKDMKTNPQQHLNLRDPVVLTELTEAVIHHENGHQPYDPQTLDAGITMALA